MKEIELTVSSKEDRNAIIKTDQIKGFMVFKRSRNYLVAMEIDGTYYKETFHTMRGITDMYSNKWLRRLPRLNQTIQILFLAIIEVGPYIKGGKSSIVVKKQVKKASLHRDKWYYNMPFKYIDLNKFMAEYDLKMGGRVFSEEDNVFDFIRPSNRSNGKAYTIISEIPEI